MKAQSDIFDIPVALFMFKRIEKTALIVDQIARVKPSKLYLIADGPRDDSEREAVEECRRVVEQHVTWPCELIKDYADVNRGVYENIAGGAMRVFECEDKAIFLEDDNFPALSFFSFCRELLEKYDDDSRVLWICGTNYLGETHPTDGSDYYFTKLMLPCGWASWKKKFTRFYDGHLSLFRNEWVKKNIRYTYSNKLLYQKDVDLWDLIIHELDNGQKPHTWDYQMAFSLRVNNLFGIAPRVNLISNIGADIHSIHGGSSMNMVMTSRFCEVPVYEMTFPLRHPAALLVEEKFEKDMEKVIIPPAKYRFRGRIATFVKRILGIDKFTPLREGLK